MKIFKWMMLGLMSLFAVAAMAEQTYRFEIGYAQPYMHQGADARTYYDGIRIGGTVDFSLPLKQVTVQTGLYYTGAYGYNEQKYPHAYAYTNEYVGYDLWLHSLDIPVRATGSIKIWKDLSIFAFAGPTFGLGVAHTQHTYDHLTDATRTQIETTLGQHIETGTKDLYTAKEQHRFNMQLGAGGGLQWQKYRIQAGYDFGLNNQSKGYEKMTKWQWFASFSYAF